MHGAPSSAPRMRRVSHRGKSTRFDFSLASLSRAVQSTRSESLHATGD